MQVCSKFYSGHANAMSLRQNKLIWLSWFHRGYSSVQDIATWHFDGHLACGI